MDKWKNWELAGMLALCMCFLAGLWAGQTQNELVGGLVRLHVVANSDSRADQSEKMAMRDRVLEILGPALAEVTEREQAVDIIQSKIPELEALGDVKVSLENEYFPSRYYVNFSLPAGEYLALRVVLGEGAGHNWWCVLYPPLCTDALAVDSEEAFAALSEQEKALVTQSDEGYVLKFKVVEWWSALTELLR